jgi:hypothetical protein
MKGRSVPSYPAERLAAARAAFAQHGDAMQAAAAALPRVVRLNDGRTLRALQQMSGGLAYCTTDGLCVVASFDATAHGLLLHVSASYANRLPTCPACCARPIRTMRGRSWRKYSTWSI